jgi:hypothetical protein
MRLLQILRSKTDSMEAVQIEIHGDAAVFYDHLLKSTGRRACSHGRT